MIYSYPAYIKHCESDDVFEVEFPDLPGCLTYGETFDDACKNASEALTGYLESVMCREVHFRAPSKLLPDTICIEPEKSVAFALWLRSKRKDAGLTLCEVADRLDVRYQVYQRLEDPSKTNPTLKTLAKLEQVYNEKIILI